MQSTSCEMPGWIKHRLESRFLGEISVTSDKQSSKIFHFTNGKLSLFSTENALISPSFLKYGFSEYIIHGCQLEKKILPLKNMPISFGCYVANEESTVV